MNDDLLVQDALTSVSYRVYPDTPFAEILDLMVRRRLHAVPVVGEDYEVLGIITTGDALQTVLRRSRGGSSGEGKHGEGLVARDVMTRTVLCVSEDQRLTEAAQMMANRDVEQLPVVRDGALVGFLTRDSVLLALQGGDRTSTETDTTEEEP
jgi:CBS domain-containing protein